MAKLFSFSRSRRRKRERIKVVKKTIRKNDFNKRDTDMVPFRVKTESPLTIKPLLKKKVVIYENKNNNHSRPAQPVKLYTSDLNKKQTVCRGRRERKQVLFALGVAGSKRLGKPIWNENSFIRCS